MNSHRAALRQHYARRKVEPRFITIETRNRCAVALAQHGKQLSNDENKMLLDLIVRHSLNVPVTKETLDAAMGLLGRLGQPS
jgi:hypothetical protein